MGDAEGHPPALRLGPSNEKDKRGEHSAGPCAAHRRYFHAGRLGAAQIKYGLCRN